MSTSIFANPYNQKTQVWSTQGAKVYIPKKNGDSYDYSTPENNSTLACIQGVTASITRAISDQYPLGTGSIIRLVGAPTGTASFTSLLGPQANIKNFILKVSNVCSPCDIVIQPISQQTFSDGCTLKAKTVTIILKGCTANQVQLSIQAAQQGLSLVNVPVNVQFTDMTWDQASDSAGTGGAK